MENLLVKLQNLFRCKKPIISIFSPDKELIIDLIEIKSEYKYIYISKSIICKGISIISSHKFIELYLTEFNQYLKLKKDNTIKIKDKNKSNNNKLNNNIFKYKIRKGINEKREKLKNHYSFALGENEIESIDYIYYSENEEKKNKAYEDIYNNCFFKNDFYIYINEKGINEKIKALKNKLNFNKFFDLRKSYNKFNPNFNTLLDRYKKELSKKLGINTINFNSDKDKKYYDFEDLDNQFDKLFLKRESEKEKINRKLNKKIYHNIDKTVNQYYAYFVLYNIPKLLRNIKTMIDRDYLKFFLNLKI